MGLGFAINVKTEVVAEALRVVWNKAKGTNHSKRIE